MSSKVTLEKFYNEFLKFMKLQELRWNNNDKNLNRLNKKIDKHISFIDRDVMQNRKRITALEQKSLQN